MSVLIDSTIFLVDKTWPPFNLVAAVNLVGGILISRLMAGKDVVTGKHFRLPLLPTIVIAAVVVVGCDDHQAINSLFRAT